MFPCQCGDKGPAMLRQPIIQCSCRCSCRWPRGLRLNQTTHQLHSKQPTKQREAKQRPCTNDDYQHTLRSTRTYKNKQGEYGQSSRRQLYWRQKSDKNACNVQTQNKYKSVSQESSDRQPPAPAPLGADYGEPPYYSHQAPNTKTHKCPVENTRTRTIYTPIRNPPPTPTPTSHHIQRDDT